MLRNTQWPKGDRPFDFLKNAFKVQLNAEKDGDTLLQGKYSEFLLPL